MTKSIHIVKVPLGPRTYPIYIGTNILGQIGSYCRRHMIGKTVVVITDTRVAGLHLSTVKKSLQAKNFLVLVIILPHGESQKSIRTTEQIYSTLLKNNVERSATIIALGGGVIGDLAGFIAATYQRGISFIQIPTTLLSQVDSSVGGKTGINHQLAKNMIGAFHQPKFVLIDTAVLNTLPKREMISGMAEVVKYGMILDKKFFGFIEQHLDDAFAMHQKVLMHMIRRSCQLKAYVVSRDEHEQHLRAKLNFGHTIGHALEHAGHYGQLKHGEAIFYGMIGESFVAHESGMFAIRDQIRMEQLIQRIPIPSLAPMKLKNSALIETMKKDKKTIDGAVRMSLPHSIGKVSLPIGVSIQSINRAIDYVKEYAL